MANRQMTDGGQTDDRWPTDRWQTADRQQMADRQTILPHNFRALCHSMAETTHRLTDTLVT